MALKRVASACIRYRFRNEDQILIRTMSGSGHVAGMRA
jgi:hypothetical protein